MAKLRPVAAAILERRRLFIGGLCVESLWQGRGRRAEFTLASRKFPPIPNRFCITNRIRR